MGYQITFIPTEEKIKEYKPWNEEKAKDESYLEDYKRELVHYCMKKHANATPLQLAKEIGWKIRCIYSAVEQDERKRVYFNWKENENHEVWYCGWEFAHDSYFDKDEFIDNKINDMLVFADLIETPDYFEDSEHFYKKLSDVREEVDGIVEIFEDIVIHNIIDDLREFEEKYDDDEEDKKIERMTPEEMIEVIETWNHCSLSEQGREKVKNLTEKGLSYDVIGSMLESADKIDEKDKIISEVNRMAKDILNDKECKVVENTEQNKTEKKNV